MVVGKVYGDTIKSLWNGRCTITVRDHGTVNENTGRVIVCETDIYKNEPCRISFDTVNVTMSESSAAKIVQSTTLFISNSLKIPAGSKITVTQNSVTSEYKQSGIPAVYSSHQEIPLEIFEGWA